LNLSYQISQLLEIVDGKCNQSSKATIQEIFIDSRKSAPIEHSLFVAIEGEINNGHHYIESLYKKGHRFFLVNETFDLKDFKNAFFIQVESTIVGLQKIAKHHRSKFNFPVIGITGSNGKTSVKEWLYEILSIQYNVIRSPKSYNSQVGVPLSLLEMSDNYNLAIIEAGISNLGQMDKLADMIQPTHGVFTYLGDAHQVGFESLEQKAIEKSKLFSASQVVFYNQSHQTIKKNIEHLNSQCWGPNGDLQIHSIEPTTDQTNALGSYNGIDFDITIPFTDNASVENVILCWLISSYLGVEQTKIQHKVNQLKRLALRLEQMPGRNGSYIINDSYSLDLASLSIALKELEALQMKEKSIVILSDMPGDQSAQLYQELGKALQQNKVDLLVGIGHQISKYQYEIGTKGFFYASLDDFLENSDLEFINNAAILVKGSRKFGFERVVSFLQDKLHETKLEVNLTALADNLNHYKSLLKPDTKIMAMVKAFAYGSGDHTVSRLLQFNGVDYLAVAYTDEGVSLRKAGIHLPIMVMNPEVSNFDLLTEYELEPEVFSHEILDAFVRHLILIRHQTPHPIHVKIDTGMHRLGFEHHEIGKLIGYLKSQPEVRVSSVLTHLAASDNSSHDQFTHQQIDTFDRIANQLIAGLNYPIYKHVTNTAGITRFPAAHFDMVRLGIGLYGIGELETLSTTSTLSTTITQIKQIKKGDSVGYDRSYVAEQNMTIGVIPIGYADGFRRNMSNGKGKVWINGHLSPVVGNVCMDMAMIDLSQIDAKPGDYVEVFGKNLSIVQLSEYQDTIPYEIMTGVSSRVKRLYIKD